MDHGSILLKERCLHGYQTELAGQMKDLKDRFKKIEDDTCWSRLEEEVMCLVIKALQKSWLNGRRVWQKERKLLVVNGLS